MTAFSRPDTDGGPSRCAFCGEIEHVGQPHLWCQPVNRPRGPAPLLWPTAKPEHPGTRRAAAVAAVQVALARLEALARELGALTPDAVLESEDDHRTRSSAISRLESLGAELADVVRQDAVART